MISSKHYIYYQVSPSFNELIAKKLLSSKETLQPEDIPSTSSFHLIENGEHFLVVSKIDKFRPGSHEDLTSLNKHELSDEIGGDLEIKTRKYTFKEMKSDKEVQTIHFIPNSEKNFLSFLKGFTSINLDKKRPSEIDSTKDGDTTSFSIKNMTFSLSREIQGNLQGERELSHVISLDLLKKCMEKKYNFIRNQIKKPNLPEELRLPIYFFDEKKGHVLNIVILSRGDNKITILTAYYPSDNYIKSQLNYSNVQYNHWKDNQITKV